jgi:blue copper oxidase
MFNRRETLKALGLGAAGAACMPRLMAQTAAPPGQFANPLKIPPLEAGSVTDGVRHYDLTLGKSSSTFLPGTTTETFGVNGDYLGPTLLMQRDEQVAMAVHNRLEEPTTLHWHGFHVPAIADGGPHQQIEHGESWHPGFRVRQNGGTFWYHSHVLHKAGEQVFKGLAGMILVRDEQDSQLGLPGTYGVDDIPLVVQDRRFGNSGNFSYMSRYEDMVKGMHGDTILVNGTWQPLFVPTTRLVRFRLLNGANARTFTFAFDDGRRFHQIASDGGLLSSPVPMDRLELYPGERAEILVDFSDGQEVTLVSLAMNTNFPVFQGALSEIMRSLNTQAFDILRIQPSSSLEGEVRIPERLANIERPVVEEQMQVRQFRLSMGFGTRSGANRGPGTGTRSGLGGGHGGGNSSINGRVMDIDYINATIPVGSTEVWELTNNSPMAHPFHVHHGQFLILDRNGNPPPPNEMGWKDTVKVGSGELVRIMMRFENFVDPDNPYMYHCHILEHEDQGMMGQFLIV